MGRRTKMMNIVLEMVGGGATGVASQLASMVGVNVSDDIAAILVGLGVDNFGKGAIKPVGRGMAVVGGANLASNALGGLLPGGGGNPGGAGLRFP